MAVKVVVEVELTEHEYAALKKFADGDNVDDVAHLAISRFIRQQVGELDNDPHS